MDSLKWIFRDERNLIEILSHSLIVIAIGIFITLTNGNKAPYGRHAQESRLSVHFDWKSTICKKTHFHSYKICIGTEWWLNSAQNIYVCILWSTKSLYLVIRRKREEILKTFLMNHRIFRDTVPGCTEPPMVHQLASISCCVFYAFWNNDKRNSCRIKAYNKYDYVVISEPVGLVKE